MKHLTDLVTIASFHGHNGGLIVCLVGFFLLILFVFAGTQGRGQ